MQQGSFEHYYFAIIQEAILFKRGIFVIDSPGNLRQTLDINLSLSFCSVVIWLGDLNYRFDDLEVDQVKVLIDNNKLDELYKFDQVWSFLVALSLSLSLRAYD